MVDGKWPAEPYLVKGSIGVEGKVPWTRDNSSVEALADGFESFYADQLRGSKTGATDYSMWYDRLINSLRADEVLKFFADGEAEHEWWLRDAPGFKKSDEL